MIVLYTSNQYKEKEETGMDMYDGSLVKGELVVKSIIKSGLNTTFPEGF